MLTTLTKPVLLFTLLAAVIPSAASAATATTSFAVSATVADSCTVSAAALSFGAYAVASDSAATTTVTATCTNGTTYHVALDDGGNFTTTRRMTDGTSFLEYELYTDAGHATRWGSTDTTDVDGTGDGSAQALTVYGLVPSGQFVTAGSYTDTINITVTYP
jgi:spore coat protein U-like protein